MSEWCPQHDTVGPADNGLTNVSAGAKTAIGHHGHVAAGAAEVVLTRCGAFKCRCNLGHSYADNFPGGAGSSGTDADKYAIDSGFHEFLGNFIGNAVSDHDRDL